MLDGEIAVTREIGGRTRLDWESLSQRIHPAESRVRKLCANATAHLIGLDALASALMKEPFRARREALIDEGELHMVGGAASFTDNDRLKLAGELEPLREENEVADGDSGMRSSSGDGGPASCTFDQLEVPLTYDLFDVLETNDG